MRRTGLVADAGGTNVRFALVDLDRPGAGPVAQQKFASRNFARIEDAARTYLEGQGLAAPPEAAVIAVAGPVSGNSIAMTNLGWRFSGSALEKSLGIGTVTLINDFEAIAHSISSLGESDLRAVGAAAAVPQERRQTVAIIGPGTGLGVGGYMREAGAVLALVTEGGHSDFAPSDETDIEILKMLRRRFGHVSAERLLSGPGLVNLHEALTSLAGRTPEALAAAQITARALAEPESFSAQVLGRFCGMLGSFAGNVALVMGAREGVYIAGGIVPAIADFFAASAFRARFDAKGRFEAYMKAIPTTVIVQEFAGLIGAASVLRASMEARD